jgi:hypothetical protein
VIWRSEKTNDTNPRYFTPCPHYPHNNDFLCLPLFLASSVAIARFVVRP